MRDSLHPDGEHTDVFNLEEDVYAETFSTDNGYGFRIADAVEQIYQSKMSFGRRQLAERAARKMHAYFVDRGRLPRRTS